MNRICRGFVFVALLAPITVATLLFVNGGFRSTTFFIHNQTDLPAFVQLTGVSHQDLLEIPAGASGPLFIGDPEGLGMLLLSERCEPIFYTGMNTDADSMVVISDGRLAVQPTTINSSLSDIPWSGASCEDDP